MPENARLNGCLDEIDLDFMEREATPQLLMKLGIQLHLTGLSLSNTVSVLEVFGVERARSTVHNWIHKANLQPDDGQSPDHVAVDETVIRLNDEQYWLYAAVDPETNELLHTRLETTTNNVLAHSFLTELAEKHDIEEAVFLVDGSHSLQHACRRRGFDFRYEQHGNRNSVEHVFCEVKRRSSSFSHASAMPTQKLLRSGSDRSPSHGISVSEHYHGHVHQMYATVTEWADGDDLSETVAVMVNVLNAAGLPVEAAFVHALADEPANHRTIERTLDFLEGSILEQSESDFRMPHPQWSALYLERMLKVEGKRLARDRFEQCVRALFRLLDDQSRRKRVLSWVRDPPEAFIAITETPEETAVQFVEQVAEIGTNRPTLSVLYGPFERWQVPLPDPCPSSVRLLWVIRCGQIHHAHGALDAAQAELERSGQLIDTEQNEFAAPARYQALVRHGFGLVASDRGEWKEARKNHQRSLTLCRKTGDCYGEASNLNSLGNIANERRKWKTAKEYYKESMTLCREIGSRQDEATCLTNLGLVANERGKFGPAEDYHEKALALKRETGNCHGEAKCLINLGTVARTRGELEVAQEYYEEALPLLRETGDRPGEARCLTNLGRVIYDRGQLRIAKDRLEKALTLNREFGDRHGEATDLKWLGLVAYQRGEVKAAAEFFKEAAALCQDNARLADMLERVIDTIAE